MDHKAGFHTNQTDGTRARNTKEEARDGGANTLAERLARGHAHALPHTRLSIHHGPRDLPHTTDHSIHDNRNRQGEGKGL